MKKTLYLISSLTWGILGTLAGFFVWLFFLILKKKSYQYKGSLRTNIGDFADGGCVSLGLFTFTSTDDKDIGDHEFGHCIQNAILGPLMIFVVWIPSVVDYWKCEAKGDFSSHNELFCEVWATKLGSKDW